MANPNASGTAYTAIATLVQVFGEDAAFKYLKALHKNINTYPRSGTAPIKAVARGETIASISFIHDAVTEAQAGFRSKAWRPARHRLRDRVDVDHLPHLQPRKFTMALTRTQAWRTSAPDSRLVGTPCTACRAWPISHQLRFRKSAIRDASALEKWDIRRSTASQSDRLPRAASACWKSGPVGRDRRRGDSTPSVCRSLIARSAAKP
jgi:hypothetical protein